MAESGLEYVDKQKYTTTQIITYMGNKRKLLPIIEEALDEIMKGNKVSSKLRVGDGFSGSGIVSRLLKTKAKELYTNDLAGYSKTLNMCYLAEPKKTMQKQIKKYIDNANKRADEIQSGGKALSGCWISNHWSPKTSTITESDRAYYTRENGWRIDVMRNYTESIPEKYRSYVLAPLLVECSIHNNTNGQFAAFYKDKDGKKGEYGGKTGTDIKRITQDIRIPYPIFEESGCKSHRMGESPPWGIRCGVLRSSVQQTSI